MQTRKYLIFFLAVGCIMLLAISFGVASALRSAPEEAASSSASQGSRPLTASLMHFSLSDMAERADKIFRGTVVDFSPGTVVAGGGELPMVVYRLRVDQAFKGIFETKGDTQYVELRIVGTVKDGYSDDTMAQFNALPAPPELLVGHDYLLFTTAPSAIGLSTAVGLGQGSFEIFTLDKQERAKNEFDNAGLFDGAVPYSQLVANIEAILAAE